MPIKKLKNYTSIGLLLHFLLASPTPSWSTSGEHRGGGKGVAGLDGHLARAEARLAELGPDTSERLRLMLEEIFAHGLVAEANADAVMADACADAVEALGNLLDLRAGRSGRATADAGSA